MACDFKLRARNEPQSLDNDGKTLPAPSSSLKEKHLFVCACVVPFSATKSSVNIHIFYSSAWILPLGLRLQVLRQSLSLVILLLA